MSSGGRRGKRITLGRVFSIVIALVTLVSTVLAGLVAYLELCKARTESPPPSPSFVDPVDHRDKPRTPSDYERWMAEGRKAADLEHWDQASSSFQAALALKPDDAEAAEALRLAETTLNEIKQETAAHEQHVRAGRSALEKRQWENARKAFTEALALKPNDPLTNKALARAIEGAQLQAQYLGFMKAGQTAMDHREWHQAISAFQAAVDVKPHDPDAEAGLGKARLEAEFARLIDQGTEAMTRGQWQQAALAFQAALNIKPGDLPATTALEKARAVLEESRRKEAEYQTFLVESRASVERRDWTRALNAAQSALGLKPNDREARSLAELAQQERRRDIVVPGPAVVVLNGVDYIVPYIEAGSQEKIFGGELNDGTNVMVLAQTSKRYQIKWQFAGKSYSGWVDRECLRSKE